MTRPLVLLITLASLMLGAIVVTSRLLGAYPHQAGSESSASAATAPAATTDSSADIHREGGTPAAMPASVQGGPQSSQDSRTEAAVQAQAGDLHDVKDDSGGPSLERLAPLPALAQLPDGRWKAGVNYDTIVPAQQTSAPSGKIEVLEVFWLGCPHCFALEPYLQNWLKNKPRYIDFVRVPVMWGPVHRLHAKLFYTLEALNRDDLVEKAFTTIHQDNNPLIGSSEQDTFQKQLEWAKANGIDGGAFTMAYNSFGVNASLDHAQEITERYHVEGVPMIVVDGKYETDVGKAGGHEQLIQLINDLAAFDHGQRAHRA